MNTTVAAFVTWLRRNRIDPGKVRLRILVEDEHTARAIKRGLEVEFDVKVEDASWLLRGIPMSLEVSPR